MNRLQALFERKSENILNIFCTAGYPKLDDIVPVVQSLEAAGADIVEIGVPYSDPTADGPTIQYSNGIALENGMNVHLLFQQLEELRKSVDLPIILMGDINPVLQYGIDEFLAKCGAIGVDGLILPNLPVREYEVLYKEKFEANNISNIFLITPQTSEERIRKIDSISNGFIYVVSTFAITGGNLAVENQVDYFKRVQAMNLKNPTLIGFGIRDKATFEGACQFANGAIIGSAFIKVLDKSEDVVGDSRKFVESILK